MTELPACPQCGMENTYPDGADFICPDCAHEWPMQAPAATESGVVVRDCNGNVLAAGDTVVVIKDLKVKGSSIPLKCGATAHPVNLNARPWSGEGDRQCRLGQTVAGQERGAAKARRSKLLGELL